MWKWFSRWVVVLALLLACVRIADLVSRRGPQLPPLPADNVYPRLLASAGTVEIPGGDVSMMTETEVRRLSAANRDHLLLVHADVRGESGVPLSTTRGWVETHAVEQRSFKRLAAALGVQARAEELEGRTNGVAAAWLDLLLLGPAMSRSGILSDSLSGLALESVGLMGLRPMVPSLDAAFCRSAAQDLEKLEARRDAPTRVLETEANWSRVSFGLVDVFGGLLRGSGKARREAEFAQRHHPVVRRTRLLALQLAARALELERGTPVKTADEVVPAVLKAVPLDPESGKPLELPTTLRGG